MKSSIAAVILAFAHIAAAQPHARHVRHQQFHKLDKRDDLVIEEVVVAISDGVPISTYTDLITTTFVPDPVTSTTTAAVVAAVDTGKAAADPAPTQTAQAAYVAPPASDPPAPASAAAPAASPAPAPAPASAPASGGLFGVTYDEYDDNNQPKSEATINAEIAKMTGYGVIRLYDATDRTPLVIKAAKANGLKVFAGVNNGPLGSGGLSDALNFIADGAKAAGWDTISAIGIGNEWVFQGKSASDLMGFIASAKSTLAAQGYTGPVVAPDTSAAYVANPILCNGDFAAVSAHSFFQPGGCPPDDAAKSVKAQYDNVVAACPGKDVEIVETGWPNASGPGSPSVGSPASQKTVIDGIKALFPKGNVIFISALDEPRKVTNMPDPYGIEAHWGMLGA